MKFRTAFLALSTLPMLLAQNAPNTSMPTIPGPPPPQAAPAVPVSPNTVVLVVGDTKLTAAEYESLIDALPAQYQNYARTNGKRAFAENLTQLLILSSEAEKRGLDRQPKVSKQLSFQRENILAGAMFELLQQDTKVDEAAIKAYYDAHQTEYESVRAKHILIRVKGAPMPAPEGKPELTDEQALAKALDIVKKLQTGGDFSALAKSDSDDTGSAAQGGDLGEFHKGMMVPPFETAAFALKPGEISEPVKSPFGYHIIVVQEHKAKPLAEVRPDIEKALRPEAGRKLVEAMRAKANVKIDDNFFGPEPPPSPSSPVK